MSEPSFEGRGRNLSDFTIGTQIAPLASKFKEEFKPEFVKQIVGLGVIFDTCILNGNIEGAQQIRDAYAIGAQLQQKLETPANTIGVEILDIMNVSIHGFFLLQNKPLPIGEKSGAQNTIVAYQETMTSLLRAKS